jgi:hypothetical protein
MKHGSAYRAGISTRKCEAGCGRTVKERRRRFCSNSCAKAARPFGQRAPKYNGGVYVDRGRTYICCRDGSGVAFYRAVVEADLGRHLLPTEHVHHRNGDPGDDRPENLEVLSQVTHNRTHNAKLTRSQVGEIKSLLRGGWSGEAIGRAYGVSGQTIHRIRHGVTWKDVA